MNDVNFVSVFEDSGISIGYSSDKEDVFVYIQITDNNNKNIIKLFDNAKILELSEKLETVSEILQELKTPKTIILH